MAATRLTTDIEKKSLEAHVELCAERYKNLDGKLNSLDDRMSAIDGRMDKLEGHMLDIKDKIGNVSNEGNKTLITIGTSILGILLTAVVGIIIHLATNTPS
jgi:predicted nuclease with TOPRIM domain